MWLWQWHLFQIQYLFVCWESLNEIFKYQYKQVSDRSSIYINLHQHCHFWSTSPKRLYLSILICLQNNTQKNKKFPRDATLATLPPSRDPLFSLCSFIYVMTFVVWWLEWLSNIMSDATNYIAHGHCPLPFFYIPFSYIYFFLFCSIWPRAPHRLHNMCMPCETTRKYGKGFYGFPHASSFHPSITPHQPTVSALGSNWFSFHSLL